MNAFTTELQINESLAIFMILNVFGFLTACLKLLQPIITDYFLVSNCNFSHLNNKIKKKDNAYNDYSILMPIYLYPY